MIRKLVDAVFEDGILQERRDCIKIINKVYGDKKDERYFLLQKRIGERKIERGKDGLSDEIVKLIKEQKEDALR